jgi:hypothetical protein
LKPFESITKLDILNILYTGGRRLRAEGVAVSEEVRAKRKETKVLAEMFDTRQVAIKLPTRVVVRGVRKAIAEKDSLKPKVVNRAGKVGVELDALTRVRVRLWLDALTHRAGCTVAELSVLYEMPETARFDLYDALRRKPHPSTLRAVDLAEAQNAVRTQPFRGTSLIYQYGPGALDIWRVLEGKQRICRNVLNGEFRRVFSKEALRWGVPFSKKVDALVRAVPGAASADMLSVLQGDAPHPVALQFEEDIQQRDVGAREIAIETWQSPCRYTHRGSRWAPARKLVYFQ